MKRKRYTEEKIISILRELASSGQDPRFAGDRMKNDRCGSIEPTSSQWQAAARADRPVSFRPTPLCCHLCDLM